MRLVRSLLLGFCLASATAAPARSADTLELGITELAQQIVRSSRLNNATTIAVAAFPHADNTCSELSNYIVDELVLGLFTIPDAGLQIIERAQLQAILAELGLGLTGAMDPNTTREIGRIHGVSSLIVGSITVVGDRLRIIARMIGTETGAVYAAAATTIPRTDTVTALMSRPAVGGCGLVAQAPVNPAAPGQVPTLAQPGPAQPAQTATGPIPGAIASLTQGDLVFSLINASRSTDKARVNMMVGVTNTGTTEVTLIWVAPIPTVTDQFGNFLPLFSLSGHAQCDDQGTLRFGLYHWFNANPGDCIRNVADRYVVIPAGATSFSNLSFRQLPNGDRRLPSFTTYGDRTIDGTAAWFAGTVQVRSSSDQALIPYRNFAISIPNVPLTPAPTQ